MTLSELAGIIDDLVKDMFYNQVYWIVAETADVKKYPDRGYCFVTLVEKEGPETKAKMEGVIWSKHYPALNNFEASTGIRFDKNIRVLLKVGVDFSPVYGLKLQIMDIDPSYTAGEIDRQKQQILDRLVKENPGIVSLVDGTYITQNARLARPLVFQKIALITAPDSDGRRDFLHETGSNPYHYVFHCDEYLTRIQGESAEDEIIDCLNRIKTSRRKYDAVIIVRGGGSQLDFGPFDTYPLGLTIAGSPIPVITGIGHERNVSITDLMSHLQVKTPTKAASFLVDHNHKFEEDIEGMLEYICNLSGKITDGENKALLQLRQRLSSSLKLYLSAKKNELDRLSITLRHLDPENILKRGYALVMKNDNIIIKPESIDSGDEVVVRLQNTFFRTLVQSKTEKNES